MAVAEAESVQSSAVVSALAALRAGGLDLAGALDAVDYDALMQGGWLIDRLLPGARSILVVGSAGQSLGRAVDLARESESASAHPFDDHCRSLLDTVAAALPGPGRALLYADRLGSDARAAPDGTFADLVGLAQAAGLGRAGRLRLLLHPEFGPWLSIRGLIASAIEAAAWRAALGPSPGLAVPATSLCDGCAAPCVAACPGGALDHGPLDLGRCQETRLANPACEERCDARRDCVLGREHAYAPAVEAHHARASLDFVRSRGNEAPSEA